MSSSSSCRPPVRGVAVVVLLGVGACAAPHVPTRPLAPATILREVDCARSAPRFERGLSLGTATDFMRRHNPEVRRARVQYATLRARADVATPLPNPSINAGPLLLGGADILSGTQVGALAGIGWSAVLGGKRSLNDCVNAVRARAAFVEAASIEREQYLHLRGEFLDAAMQARLQAARTDLTRAAEKAEAAFTRVAEAGDANRVDVRLVTMETTSFRLDAAEGEEARQQSMGALAARMGMEAQDPATPSPSLLPTLPSTVPEARTLQQVVLDQHPRLASLRARYTVAEKELRLEAAQVWPDLQFGAEFEDEVEVQKLGIPLGIELPIFDRNQQAVAEAEARRDGLRELFAAQLNESLAAVENARALVETRMRIRTLASQQLDAADQLEREAAELLDATGSIDMVRYLGILRTTQRVRLESLEAERALFAAWSALERACGVPLLRFPAEPGTSISTLPVASVDTKGTN